MFQRLREDIDAVFDRDPAARSRLEVLIAYPGIHAALMHRLSHRLWKAKWRTLARFLSHVGRGLSGIEIHPGATIGRRFFVDHGMGVVIGETAEIGDDVTLYQGVTLGGTSLEPGKRHPTLEDGVIVGAGAKVLGPLTIGKQARVGSNAVVVKDVPAGASVVGIPAREINRGAASDDNHDFIAYGTRRDLPDPVGRSVEAMLQRLEALGEEVKDLEARLAVTEGKAATGTSDAAKTAAPAQGEPERCEN